jgi:hypothetical protein
LFRSEPSQRFVIERMFMVSRNTYEIDILSNRGGINYDQREN